MSATRCGVVAVVGAPNAGKSTLVNALVGQKVAITSAKAQTTRARMMGIAIAGESQIVLVDTPGIFTDTRRRLDRAMVAAAWGSAVDADAIALVVDARVDPGARVEAILEGLADRPEPKLLVLNKVDIADKGKLLTTTAALNARIGFADSFMISALTGDGVADLRSYLASAVPLGPWLFPEDQLTDASLRQTAAEITREKLFLRLHEELPYQLTVETADWKELKDGSVRIEQTIYVTRESQRKMVLGAKGQTIKEIGSAAREEIAEIAGVPVHLFLFVKVRERWGEDPERYREMGLDFPKDR